MKQNLISLVIKQTDLIISYMKQILEAKKEITGQIELNVIIKDNVEFCSLDVYLPEIKKEEHIDLEIPKTQDFLLFSILIEALFDEFSHLKHITSYSICDFEHLLSIPFHGTKLVNQENGNSVKLVFRSFSYEGEMIYQLKKKEYNEKLEHLLNKNFSYEEEIEGILGIKLLSSNRSQK